MKMILIYSSFTPALIDENCKFVWNIWYGCKKWSTGMIYLSQIISWTKTWSERKAGVENANLIIGCDRFVLVSWYIKCCTLKLGTAKNLLILSMLSDLEPHFRLWCLHLYVCIYWVGRWSKRAINDRRI